MIQQTVSKHTWLSHELGDNKICMLKSTNTEFLKQEMILAKLRSSSSLHNRFLICILLLVSYSFGFWTASEKENNNKDYH